MAIFTNGVLSSDYYLGATLSTHNLFSAPKIHVNNEFDHGYWALEMNMNLVCSYLRV